MANINVVNKSTWIQTFTGKEFFPFNPTPEMIDIVDIAHALSNKCRYSGHCKKFYSVAQHSVYVSALCPSEFKLWGLLHDAAEAYFSDIPSPIKRANPIFEEIENPILDVIISKFGLSSRPAGKSMPDEVKKADIIMLATESKDLLKWRTWNEQFSHLTLPSPVKPISPQKAKKEFLETFEILSKGSCPAI